MRELIRWGGNFLFPMREDDEFEPDWGLLALEAIACRTRTPAQDRPPAEAQDEDRKLPWSGWRRGNDDQKRRRAGRRDDRDRLRHVTADHRGGPVRKRAVMGRGQKDRNDAAPFPACAEASWFRPNVF
jgi:hypothetical protein